jgi:AcrR family transcriptional regulator
VAIRRDEWLQIAEQQGATTRNALLTESVKLIAELGYSRFSTQLLAERTSVSRGALQYHFGNRKIDLIAAVAKYVYDRFHENAALKIPVGADIQTAVEKTIDSAYEIYKGPEAVVLVELWMAARSDLDLKMTLAPILANLDDAIASGFGSRFGGASNADEKRIETVRYLARFVFRGMTLERQMWIDDELEGRVVALLKKLMIGAIDPPLAD